MEIFDRLNISYPSWGEGDLKVRRPGPTADAVSAFESHFGIQLPADYLAFLREYNGGYPTRSVFHLKQFPPGYPAESEYDINLFFYLDDNRTGNYNLWKVTERFRPFIGKTGLPIAEDGFGDIIFIDTKTGQVLYATHEADFEKAVIADNFMEFIGALEDEPEDE